MADENVAIKHHEHLLLEQPLLRLPNELLRKNFRSAHFAIEKDTTLLKTLLRDAANASVSGRASRDDVLRHLDAAVTRMRGMRRKLTTYVEEEERLHTQSTARIVHVNELFAFHTVDDVNYESWSRRRLDILIADYLLRGGCVHTARELADRVKVSTLVDVDTFDNVRRIRDSLLGGSVTEALAWCTENKKELRKMESKLEFMLRFQQYIEIIRDRINPRPIEAVAHAKKYLVPFAAAYPKELAQVAGLLAIPPDSAGVSVYADLYDPTRWRQLADLFTTAHNTLLALPPVPLLHIALSSGLSALKTPACHLSSSLPPDRRRDAFYSDHGLCPICSTELNELARHVPYAHHTQSHVEPDLVVLPNGMACNKQRLLAQAAKAGMPPQLVKDPRSADVYPVDKLRKVYIT